MLESPLVASKVEVVKEVVMELLLVPMVDFQKAVIHLPLNLQVNEVETQFPSNQVEG
jgi:hypothetical protein